MTIDRRQFLQVSSGLCVAIALPAEALAAKRAAVSGAAAGAATPLVAYITIAPDSSVTVWSPTTEMGQGTHTAHAAIVADELGVDLRAVKVKTASPADPFRRPGAGGGPASMASGGSWGVRHWIGPLRKGAAQARAMLIAAAAARWQVAGSELALINGAVRRADGKQLTIGELALDAAKLTPPAEVPLRAAGEYRYVGRELRRLDIPDKVAGRAVFSSDFTRPNMLYACARMAPVRGAEIARIDDQATRAIKGVRDVVRFPGGVAVVAVSTWAALRGANELKLEFTPTDGDGLDSAAVSAALRNGLDAEARAVARNEDFAAASAKAAKTISAEYEVPYLAHAPMEPFSCTVEFATDGSVDFWTHTQAQDRVLNATSAALELGKDRIRVHTLYLGGGFGRRLMDDGYAAAALTARAVHQKFKAPVKFFWDRGTEFAQGYVRPTYMTRLSAALDTEGKLLGVSMRTSAPALSRTFVPSSTPIDVTTFVDPSAVQNLNDIRYQFGAFRIEYAARHNHFPLAPWRSVGATQNAFFIEVFVDEIARAAGKDPLALRRELLAHDGRALAVLNQATAKAGWGTPLPSGRARGLAYFESYGSLCAQVAEVSMVSGEPRVHRIVCALDCGDVITPDGARAQIEGGIMQGLSAALFEAQTLAGGASVQRNFDSYRLLRIGEAPKIEAHFVISKQPLGGVGEPPLPPTAPAVANALAALRGKPVRRLPLVSA
jgi:isoquinoline 1-oxidoreductase beta subunit